MKSGGSVRKGKSWERDIANFLSARFSEYLKVEKGFIRKPDSGSYFGGSNIARTETHLVEFQTFGDILCPKNFRWTIEAKHYKEPFSLNSILLQKNKILDEWIAQAEQDARQAERSPLIIIKFNNCEPFVLCYRNEHNPAHVEFDPPFIYGNFEAHPFSVFFLGKDDQFFYSDNLTKAA